MSADLGLADASPCLRLASPPEMLAKISAGVAAGNENFVRRRADSKFRVLPPCCEPAATRISPTMKPTPGDRGQYAARSRVGRQPQARTPLGRTRNRHSALVWCACATISFRCRVALSPIRAAARPRRGGGFGSVRDVPELFSEARLRCVSAGWRSATDPAAPTWAYCFARLQGTDAAVGPVVILQFIVAHKAAPVRRLRVPGIRVL